jgi:DNA-3-methyladenine glycosylase II
MESAEALRERLFSEFEVSPESIASAERDALREMGLSSAKAEYIQNIADVFVKRGYDREYFANHSDDEVVEELTAIHGVGPWTAKMFLQFCLGREDVFPVEDLGIRRAMMASTVVI